MQYLEDQREKQSQDIIEDGTDKARIDKIS